MNLRPDAPPHTLVSSRLWRFAFAGSVALQASSPAGVYLLAEHSSDCLPPLLFSFSPSCFVLHSQRIQLIHWLFLLTHTHTNSTHTFNRAAQCETLSADPDCWGSSSTLPRAHTTFFQLIHCTETTAISMCHLQNYSHPLISLCRPPPVHIDHCLQPHRPAQTRPLPVLLADRSRLDCLSPTAGRPLLCSSANERGII